MAFVEFLIDGTIAGGGGGRLIGTVLGGDGKLHVAYRDISNTDLKYAHFNGLSWDIEPLASAGNTGHGASIDLDSNGYPWISYHDNTLATVNLVRWDGVSWIYTLIDAAITFTFTSIKIDKTIDKAWVAYTNTNTSIRYASFGSGSTWARSIFDPVLGFAQEEIQLALNGSNFPVIIYTVRFGSVRTINISTWDGFGWIFGPLSGLIPTNQFHGSIVSDSLGQIHIAFQGGTSLRYGKYNGSWVFEVVASTGDLGETAIALGFGEYPVIIYRRDSNNQIRISTRQTGSWSVPVDVTPSATLHGSGAIAIDGADNKHIVSYGSLYYYLELGPPMPPVFNTASIRTVTDTTVDVAVETDVNSTTYMVIVPDGAPAPSSLQVKNGQDSFSSPVAVGFSGNVVLLAGIENAIDSLKGFNLAQLTDYDLYVVAEGTGGLQSSPTLLNFMTLATVYDPPISGPTVAECNNVLNITLFGRPSIPYYTSLVATFGYCVFALPVDNTISNHAEIALSLLAEQFK